MNAADRDLILRHLQDIPDGLGTRENIADVLAEKLLVIDRAELPTAGNHPDGWPGLWAEHPDADGTWWRSDILSPHFMRGRAIEILALVEHQAADAATEADLVHEMAEALAGEAHLKGLSSDEIEAVSRSLVRAGAKVVTP